MNITIYIALIIILLLIILFISLKFYLTNTHSSYIEVDDNAPIETKCLYDHTYNIQYCNYMANGKKYIITKTIIDALKNNKPQELTFNAETYNLPPNGKLKIRYICDTCNKIDRLPVNNNNFVVKKKASKIDKFVPNMYKMQNKYDDMTEDYIASRANYNKVDGPSPFIPIHSSSTQNSLYWNRKNASQEDQLNNILNPINRHADLLSINKIINTSIDNNNIDNILNDIETLENSISRDFTNDSPMSYVSNIFNKKYPKNSNTSVLANIDTEYIHGGLRGDAKLLN